MARLSALSTLISVPFIFVLFLHLPLLFKERLVEYKASFLHHSNHGNFSQLVPAKTSQHSTQENSHCLSSLNLSCIRVVQEPGWVKQAFVQQPRQLNIIFLFLSTASNFVKRDRTRKKIRSFQRRLEQIIKTCT